MSTAVVFGAWACRRVSQLARDATNRLFRRSLRATHEAGLRGKYNASYRNILQLSISNPTAPDLQVPATRSHLRAMFLTPASNARLCDLGSTCFPLFQNCCAVRRFSWHFAFVQQPPGRAAPPLLAPSCRPSSLSLSLSEAEPFLSRARSFRCLRRCAVSASANARLAASIDAMNGVIPVLNSNDGNASGVVYQASEILRQGERAASRR